MKAGWRHGLLAVSFIATMAAAYFAPDKVGDSQGLVSEHALALTRRVAGPASAPSDQGTDQKADGQPALVSAVDPRGDWGAYGEPIAAFGEDVPVAPSAPVAPPPAPAPDPGSPPLPAPNLQVLGRYVDGTNVRVFLKDGERNLVVKVGDTIADTYRVEDIGAQELKLRHIASNQVQSIPMPVTMEEIQHAERDPAPGLPGHDVRWCLVDAGRLRGAAGLQQRQRPDRPGPGAAGPRQTR